jgi:hypothetical protein
MAGSTMIRRRSSAQAGRRRAAAGRGRYAGGRFARSQAATRTFPMRRRPQKSGLQKAMDSVLPMLASARQATPSSKKGKAGGAALLAAAAAGAGALLRKRQSRGGETSPQNVTTPPAV